ncbi:MAG TPA: ClbS/DfsB family four-helix bundle protein [Anaerolineales bacterium]|nr:ClbS/DfsB family four-helix bundle protein [Anaerolineales bacterium]
MTEEQWIPENKHELMSAIRREWKSLMDVVARLEAAGRLTTPDEGGWSPKDNLAHLAEWMNLLMGYHMDRRPSHEVFGVPEEVTRDWDMEVINPILYERNRDRSTGDVLDELKQVYERLIQKLDSTLFEELLKPRHTDDPEKRPLLLWVLGDTSEHFAEHRATIEKML